MNVDERSEKEYLQGIEEVLTAIADRLFENSAEKRKTEGRHEIFEALSQAQGEFQEITKNAKGHYGNFVDLAEVKRGTQKALTKYGLSINQLIDHETGLLTTILGHKSGQEMVSTIKIPSLNQPMAKPQDFGIELSLFRRYCIYAMLGIAAEDDGQTKNQNNNSTRGRPPGPSKNGPPTKQKGDLSDAQWIRAVTIGKANDWTEAELKKAVQCLYPELKRLMAMKKKQYDGFIEVIELKKPTDFFEEMAQAPLDINEPPFDPEKETPPPGD